jgi:hypothetical protein
MYYIYTQQERLQYLTDAGYATCGPIAAAVRAYVAGTAPPAGMCSEQSSEQSSEQALSCEDFSAQNGLQLAFKNECAVGCS